MGLPRGTSWHGGGVGGRTGLSSCTRERGTSVSGAAVKIYWEDRVFDFTDPTSQIRAFCPHTPTSSPKCDEGLRAGQEGEIIPVREKECLWWVEWTTTQRRLCELTRMKHVKVEWGYNLKPVYSWYTCPSPLFLSLLLLWQSYCA